MFSYHMPTRIEFGIGLSEQIATFVKEVAPDASRWLVVTDPGVLNAGIVNPMLSQLRQEGYEIQVFSQVSPNPRDNECLAGVEKYLALAERGKAPVGVLAVGGGSAMDTAKAIALLSQSGGAPSDYVDGRRAYTAVAPLICVPTTAGTGSEVTRSAVITEHTTHRKMTLKHAMLRPKLALLDPQLTLTVPQHVTSATGVDALVHAIEGATCTLATPIARAFGYQAMRDIVHALPQVFANPKDIQARAQMLQGSLLAGLCFGSTDVAAVHCLAEALGGLYDTPHGVANAVFLPYVLRYNVEADLPLHADLARVMGFAESTHDDSTACQRLIEGIADFTASLNIPSLRDLPKVEVSDFERLAQMALVNGSTPSNIRAIDYDAYLQLLHEAYGDRANA